GPRPLTSAPGQPVLPLAPARPAPCAAQQYARQPGAQARCAGSAANVDSYAAESGTGPETPGSSRGPPLTTDSPAPCPSPHSAPGADATSSLPGSAPAAARSSRATLPAPQPGALR